ncbi:MAG: rhodanese-like domain-containing protein [Myxococcales bacterium]
MAVERIEPRQVIERMDRGETFMFIDARDDFHWGSSERKLPGAVRVPVRAAEDVLSRLEVKEPVVVYCSTAREDFSSRVAARLKDLGFDNVYLLKGGFEAWEDAEGPDEPKEDGDDVEHGVVI